MTEKLTLPGFMANVTMLPPLVVVFQFNPATVTDNKGVNYKDIEADLCGTAPGKQYTGGGDRTINFKLDIHGLEKGTNVLNPTGFDNGISAELATFRSFLYPASDAWAAVGVLAGDGGRRVKAPPTCYFGFGARVLECVVTEMKINETQFNSFLAPVRADVDITLAVIEREGHVLYEVDKQRRLVQAAAGAISEAARIGQSIGGAIG